MITYSKASKDRARKKNIPLVIIEIDRRHMGLGRVQMSGTCEALLAEHLNNLMNRILKTKDSR